MPSSVLKALTGGRKLGRNPFDKTSWTDTPPSQQPGGEALNPSDSPGGETSPALSLVARVFGGNSSDGKATGLKRNPFDPTSWKQTEATPAQSNPFDLASWKKLGTDAQKQAAPVGGTASRGEQSASTRPAGRRRTLKPLRVEPWEPLTKEVAYPAPLPERITKAADNFDSRYRKLTRGVHKVEVAWRCDITHMAKEESLMRGIWDVSQSRYFEREKLRAMRIYKTGKKREKEADEWKLETSIWAPRCKWSNSKGFWETEAVRCASTCYMLCNPSHLILQLTALPQVPMLLTCP